MSLKLARIIRVISIFSQFSVFKCLAYPLTDLDGRKNFVSKISLGYHPSSDGQKGLLKFILKEFIQEKENIEKKALNSSNDYSKELALLSTEISQAMVLKLAL